MDIDSLNLIAYMNAALKTRGGSGIVFFILISGWGVNIKIPHEKTKFAPEIETILAIIQ